MTIPMINILKEPYNISTTRELMDNENPRDTYDPYCRTIKKVIIKTLNSHYEVVNELLCDDCDISQMQAHFYSQLKECSAYKNSQPSKSTKMPKSLKDYASCYPKYNKDDVISDINQFGDYLSENQKVFHGSTCLPEINKPITMSKPLSTSLSPTVAYNNVLYNSKAYNAGILVIFILEVKNTNTKVYVYPAPCAEEGFEQNEHEILFSSGATVTPNTITKMPKEQKVYGMVGLSCLSKKVPVYIIEATIE